MSTSWDDLIEGKAAEPEPLKDDEAQAARDRAVEERDVTMTTSDIANRVAQLADQLDYERGMVKALKASIEEAETDIARLVLGMNPGKDAAMMIHKGRQVDVERTERWKWDKDGLKARYDGGTEPLPECVEKNYTVKKPKFEKLAPAEQAELRPFLTVEEGKPKVAVKIASEAEPLKGGDGCVTATEYAEFRAARDAWDKVAAGMWAEKIEAERLTQQMIENALDALGISSGPVRR